MQSIQLYIKPSMLASCLFTLISAGAWCIVMLLAFSWQLKLLLSLMIILSAIYAVLCYGILLLPWSCIALQVNTISQLQLVFKNGKILDVIVQANSVVTPYLTVINYSVTEKNLLKRLMHKLYCPHLVLFVDAVNADTYRHLRVWLRWAHARQLD